MEVATNPRKRFTALASKRNMPDKRAGPNKRAGWENAES